MRRNLILCSVMMGFVLLSGCAGDATFDIRRPGVIPSSDRSIFIPSNDSVLAISLKRAFVKHGWWLETQSKARYIANVSVSYKGINPVGMKCYDKGHYIANLDVDIVDKKTSKAIFNFSGKNACEKDMMEKIGANLN